MILVEIRPTKDVAYRDTTGVAFVFGADADFTDVVESTTYYLSFDGHALDHYWDAKILSFSSPEYAIDQDYGGFCKITFGTISFAPDVFTSEWPPPFTCRIIVRYTATTEDAAVVLIDSDIYLDSYNEEEVNYTINTPKFTQRLLDEGADYNGDTVPYPKAFGTVTHVTPLQVADNAGRPTYHLGGIGSGTVSRKIACFTSHTLGTKTKVTCNNAHGWSNGDTIIISGSVNFNGSHVISEAAGTDFVINVAFPTDNSERLPIAATAYTATSFIVYDGGIPLDEDDVTPNGDDTFSLEVSLSSSITMSGTATVTDLEGLATWVQARLGIYAIDTNALYNRATSPSINFWADSQMPAIDFLSEVCAFFSHYFYIKGDTLYLGDMLIDRGSETLDEYEYFTANYSAPQPTRQAMAEWDTREVDLLNVDTNFTATTSFVKTIKNRVVESLYEVSSGTADDTGTRKLMDSAATFSTDGIRIGDVAQNTDDNTSSTVVAVNETWLELQDDIFISGEAYIVGPSFPYGQDVDLTPYDDSKTNVKSALQNILGILTKIQGEIRIPISATLPDPGKKLTWGDEILVVDTTTWVRARRLSYDFDNEEIVITGEGVAT
jgi:hypothetical protein